MKIPDEWCDHRCFGEAQMVLGPLDIPPAEEIESYEYDDNCEWLIFRWNNNEVILMFEGNMVVSLSYRHKDTDGSARRYGIDFFIADAIPEVFFRKIHSHRLTRKQNRTSFS